MTDNRKRDRDHDQSCDCDREKEFENKDRFDSMEINRGGSSRYREPQYTEPTYQAPPKKNHYQRVIDVAEAVNAWRIFPRIFIGVYLYLLVSVVDWYIALPDPTMEQSTLISVIVGAGAAWFGLYTGTGGKRPPR